LLEKKNKLTKL